ncbi:MAG: hypothetical protein PHD37_17335 [Gallionellaceae bacterium]|nr:hypothetical protein [Gallionellaceae bacterium]
MTDAEKTKRIVDELRAEVRNLRAAIDRQNGAIQAIADKVMSLKGEWAAAVNRLRVT